MRLKFPRTYLASWTRRSERISRSSLETLGCGTQVVMMRSMSLVVRFVVVAGVEDDGIFIIGVILKNVRIFRFF